MGKKINNKQIFWWLGALLIGALLGLVHVKGVDAVCGFIATVYTRLFQFLAVPSSPPWPRLWSDSGFIFGYLPGTFLRR